MTDDAAVLVVTSIEDLTADLVITALNTRGVPVVRLDPADIGPDLTFAAGIDADSEVWSGPVTTPTRSVDLSHIRSVYWRRPSPWRYDDLPQQARDFARAEARHGLFGVLTALPVRYVSHPMAAIWTQRVTAEELDESIAGCPHMFQAEIAKAADIRVTVVGDTVFSSIIQTPERLLDWRAGDWDTFTYESYKVPGPIGKALVAYLDHFDLAFGCFDLILDRDEKVWWIECNPGGQWAFLPDSDAIADAFAALLQAG